MLFDERNASKDAVRSDDKLDRLWRTGNLLILASGSFTAPGSSTSKSLSVPSLGGKLMSSNLYRTAERGCGNTDGPPRVCGVSFTTEDTCTTGLGAGGSRTGEEDHGKYCSGDDGSGLCSWEFSGSSSLVPIDAGGKDDGPEFFGLAALS